ncbi:MAG: ABC transporter permease [Vicinamibacterales bacterium]|nr:hypothetical protein [Acidobacteriota bacterium]MDP6372886.1 ABC transporter permease [Vicinamibacterales bacterium]MDP6609713.1 ABC transporter permease [Vicinamibacterales bacterium]HAK54844.1 hypothetical protein [Acidobacteriota bacterium]
MTEAPTPSETLATKMPSFWAGAARVFDVSLGEMLWSRRTVFMVLVTGGPVLVAFVVRVAFALDLPAFRVNDLVVSGPTIFGLMVWVFFLRFTVPVLGVFYGTALMADEVEDRTITYLFTRPIRRGAVLMGKYLAYLACTGFVVLPSVMLIYFLVVPSRGGSLAAGFPSLLIDLVLLALGLAVYGAVFAFVGAWFRQPLLMGLVFIFGWEPAVVAVPGYLKQFSIAHYLQGLVPHAIPQDGVVSLLAAVFREVPSTASSLFWLAVIWAVAVLLAVRAVEHREYVLDQ